VNPLGSRFAWQFPLSDQCRNGYRHDLYFTNDWKLTMVDSSVGALTPLRVLDLSRHLAGPFATMMVADLGAEVIKIEQPETGDDTRGRCPPVDVRGMSTYFQSVNRNKASLVLDLNDAHDQEIARQLALSADVIVSDLEPAVLDGADLGYQSLQANPGLVYCSISGAGYPLETPGHDLLIQALGGLMSITGPPDAEPQKAGVAIVDVLAGLFATVGILAALRHRDATGEGQHVEVNLLTSLLSGLVNQATAYTSAGVVPRRLGNWHPSVAPYEPFAAADEHLVIAVGNDRQFRGLCTVVGLEALAEDTRFATNSHRNDNRDELHNYLAAEFRKLPAHDWVERCSAVGVPAGVINSIADAYSLADSLGLAPIVEVPRPDGTAVRLARNPINLSATPPSYRSAPPELGDSLRSNDPGKYDWSIR
jgi:crotonobetainyl-CoA:carnitine CoA-transferase CaiB-like acyl-CoA transferase